MHIRRLALPVLAAGFFPAVSGAWPGKVSLDACVGAFEKTLPAAPVAGSPADATTQNRRFKLIYSADRWRGSIYPYLFPTQYTYDLQANDPKTGAALARARCSADSRGTVSRLSTLPLTTGDEAAQIAGID